MKARGEADVEYPLGPALDFLRHLWELNHSLETLSMCMERHLGITAQQRLLLRCIGKYPGIGVGQLAATLHLDPGTISATLRRLEQKDLVERRQDPRDRRRASLGLTEQGRVLASPARGTVEWAVTRLLEQGDVHKIAATSEVLQRLIALLGEEFDEW